MDTERLVKNTGEEVLDSTGTLLVRYTDGEINVLLKKQDDMPDSIRHGGKADIWMICPIMPGCKCDGDPRVIPHLHSAVVCSGRVPH